jgi:hypothetical protein
MAPLTSSDEKGHDNLHLEACPSSSIPNPEKISSGGDSNVPDGYIPDTTEEKALSRSLNLKLDSFLLPFLSLLYLFNGLDRGNVGNAETQGFTDDIGAKADDLNLAVSLFFTTFVVFQPFSSAVGWWVGPKWWIPFIMVCNLSNCGDSMANKRSSLGGES